MIVYGIIKMYCSKKTNRQQECCELQRLSPDDSVKGRGLGYQMIEKVEQEARTLGYKRIYLETHTI